MWYEIYIYICIYICIYQYLHIPWCINWTGLVSGRHAPSLGWMKSIFTTTQHSLPLQVAYSQLQVVAELQLRYASKSLSCPTVHNISKDLLIDDDDSCCSMYLRIEPHRLWSRPWRRHHPPIGFQTYMKCPGVSITLVLVGWPSIM